MIKILGHRGIKGDKARPENSLSALEEGLRQGDGIETDISVSRDGTPYLVHDIAVRYVPYLFTRSRYAMRTPDGRRLDQMADSEIKLPRLSDLFALAAHHPGKILNLELKGEGAAIAALREINHAVAAGHIKKDRIIISAFDIAALKQVRALDPALQCGLILLPRGTRPAPIYPWNKTSKALYMDFSAATLQRADVQQLKPDFIVTRNAPPGTFRLLQQNMPGARLMLWGDDRALAAAAHNPALAPHICSVISGTPAALARLIRA